MADTWRMAASSNFYLSEAGSPPRKIEAQELFNYLSLLLARAQTDTKLPYLQIVGEGGRRVAVIDADVLNVLLRHFELMDETARDALLGDSVDESEMIDANEVDLRELIRSHA